jgi:ABC-2 type transport system ATP-binding protein
MVQPIIEVRDVKRSYITEVGFFKKQKKEVEALKGISFSVKKGEMFGLLGPNGAGKTTMIKILTTMLIPNSGTVSILGMDPVSEHKRLRPHINFILGGERNLYWRLSAYDNLAYFADLYKVPRQDQKKRIWELLELVGLTDVANRKVETFSKGMKQRLQIARGLINNPKILFLDEPSIGLDPVSARQLRSILHELNKQGTTVLITTHYMYEADELCDRVAFINKGKCVALDTPENLKKNISNLSIIDCKIVGIDEKKIEELRDLETVQHIAVEQQDYRSTLRIHTTEPHFVVPHIYEVMKGTVITELAISNPSLEDVYVSLVGGKVS